MLLRLIGKKVFKTQLNDQLTSYIFQSKVLRREVIVDVYHPPSEGMEPLRLFCFNDGQDLRTMRIKALMQKLILTKTSTVLNRRNPRQ
jgi:hypothetical protein